MTETINSKFKIKYGDVELEFEGSEAFIRNELLKVSSDISKAFDAPGATKPLNGVSSSRPKATNGSVDATLTTTAIAKKIGARKLQDLIVAAAIHLSLVKGLDSFSKNELWDNMKTATGYFKSSMSKNFSRDLGKLVKEDYFREISKDRYSLASERVPELQGRIA